MSVIRTIHERNYTVVDNALIRDKKLSLKAKGLAMIMLSLPNEWSFTEQWLAEQSADGISALRSTIAELEERGYLKRKRLKDEQGKFIGNDYTLFEIPFLENPIMENPILENRTLINTDKGNTKRQNTDNKTKHKYGEYKHVLLTDDELHKLQQTFTDWEERIKQLDEGIELKGYRYKSHYLAILKWAKNERKPKQSEYDKFMSELQDMYDEAVRNGE